jgi:alpha-1,3(6)-mannosylglycoprotein beta-1,6-N-acetyl-glucosaminyltransferase
VVAELAKLGYEVVTVAKEEPEHPIPQGIKSLGLQSKHGFEMLVASSKAMIGIGFPEISPSPFNAICAGVPVVMPYWGTRHDGWFKFAM